MPERRVICPHPGCGKEVSASNLARHRKQHAESPTPEDRAAECERVMGEHAAAYRDYQQHRASGDAAGQERCRPGYTAYKRAYRELLALRKAAS